MSRLVTRDFLEATFTGFKSLFEKSFSAAEPLYPRLATVVDSTSDKESYNWLGNVPALREWTDERVPGALRTHEYEIPNRKYEATIEVDRETFEDDRLGQVKPRIEELALRAACHPDELVVGLLNGGFATACYDGAYFFDSAHSEGDSGTQSNLLSAALDPAGLEAAITAMMGFKDDQGKPLGVKPDTLLVGPDNFFTAREILNSVSIVVAGSTDVEKPAGNPLSGMLNLEVSPFVEAGKWFVLATGYPVRPLIMQWRIRPEFTAVTDPSDEYVFSTDVFKYGVRSRLGAGYGLWYLAVGSSGA
ncbi:Mu-like prophage major head subunit gpT family protein [bacterium]|nr:Mu-like prophage major head subunit gpT family protein [bacterium]